MFDVVFASRIILHDERELKMESSPEGHCQSAFNSCFYVFHGPQEKCLNKNAIAFKFSRLGRTKHNIGRRLENRERTKKARVRYRVSNKRFNSQQ